MELWTFGGDARMLGAMDAARRAGWHTRHVCRAEDAGETADAVILPWPRSFMEGRLTGTALEKAQVLAMLPPQATVLHGSGVTAQAFGDARTAFDPAQDEVFLTVNAKLTAEGAIARAMQRAGRALLGATCVITGMGRIGQALTARLAALEAFVIVCARSETQMQRAHAMGAHPLPLERIAQACAQADVVFNTVPARILNEAALERMDSQALLIELASPPYGADPETAKRLNVRMAVESGLPGRYAPLDAGAALFEALQRRCGLDEGGRDDG